MSAAALAAALALVACGEDDFVNSPRPPSPVQLSARIGDDGVTVSPATIGAGPATITIANQSSKPTRLVLEGPTDDASDEILAGNTDSFKLGLEEGDYAVTNGDGDGETKLEVGPERESSRNELGLP